MSNETDKPTRLASGRPGWAQPAPVLRRSRSTGVSPVGSGFDTEARIETPEQQSPPPRDDWPPVFTSGTTQWRQQGQHSGMPPSPRR